MLLNNVNVRHCFILGVSNFSGHGSCHLKKNQILRALIKRQSSSDRKALFLNELFPLLLFVSHGAPIKLSQLPRLHRTQFEKLCYISPMQMEEEYWILKHQIWLLFAPSI